LNNFELLKEKKVEEELVVKMKVDSRVVTVISISVIMLVGGVATFLWEVRKIMVQAIQKFWGGWKLEYQKVYFRRRTLKNKCAGTRCIQVTARN